MAGMLNKLLAAIGKDANALVVVGGGASGIFLTGGYYFSMKERYEAQVVALKLQLDHERAMREQHDEYMAQKMNHERDQQALAILHTRRDIEKTLQEKHLDIQRWVLDMAFHGDYEKLRADIDATSASVLDSAPAGVDSTSLPSFLAHLVLREANEQRSAPASSPAGAGGSAKAAAPAAGAGPAYITIKVKDHLGAKLTDITVQDSLSVGDLKYEIEDRLFIPPVAQRLFFKGVRMQDGPVLEDYEVSDGSTIHLRVMSLGSADTSSNTISAEDRFARLPGKVQEFVKVNPTKLQSMFDMIDDNGDHVISHEEMKASLYNAIPGMLPQEMSAVFKAVDDNASGFISRREWMELFGQNSKRRKVEVASGLSGGYA